MPEVLGYIIALKTFRKLYNCCRQTKMINSACLMCIYVFEKEAYLDLSGLIKKGGKIRLEILKVKYARQLY